MTAWGELAALVTSTVVALVVMAADLPYAWRLTVTALVSTVVALVVSFVGPAESDDVLRAFHQKVRPPGPGWRRFGTSVPLWPLFMSWLAWAVVAVTFLSVSGWLMRLVLT